MEIKPQPLTLSDQDVFKSFLAGCPQVTSDYSFVNLWGWAPAYDLKWVIAGEMLWIRQNRPQAQFWAPVGKWREVDWPRYFERYPEFRSSLIRVPEQLAFLWKTIFKEKIVITPDRDQFDYIYDASDLALLPGNRFHKKRNLLNQFLKKHDYQYVDMIPEYVEAARAMQNDWCVWRECDSDIALANENTAIANVLSAWENLQGIIGGCILIQGEMAAYTIGERAGDDTLVVHFEKGRTDYKGIYQAVNQMFIEHVLSGIEPGVKWVNREQDLGDSGLRRAKESYHPVSFLKKYRVDFLI